MSGVARKFGGGKPAVGTPSLAWSSVVVVASLLAGASIVHNIYKPDLTLPPVESEEKDSGTKQDTEKPNGS
ncbi:transmembrane protein [Rhynchospora pubera]|uniref:Transmembrane protein n=1 Tax=Rhynchospora pubera TaxID=906938 RepID=A0AAV8DXT9_9POAL|nr:transmembrane protein [Rhynchospora pubera]